MFKTSMLVSHGHEKWSGAIRRTVEIPLFGHLSGRCGLCVWANSQVLRSYVGERESRSIQRWIVSLQEQQVVVQVMMLRAAPSSAASGNELLLGHGVCELRASNFRAKRVSRQTPRQPSSRKPTRHVPACNEANQYTAGDRMGLSIMFDECVRSACGVETADATPPIFT